MHFLLSLCFNVSRSKICCRWFRGKEKNINKSSPITDGVSDDGRVLTLGKITVSFWKLKNRNFVNPKWTMSSPSAAGLLLFCFFHFFSSGCSCCWETRKVWFSGCGARLYLLTCLSIDTCTLQLRANTSLTSIFPAKATPADSGMYTCEASNTIGAKLNSTRVVILGKKGGSSSAI